jgi:hypothetical protein
VFYSTFSYIHLRKRNKPGNWLLWPFSKMTGIETNESKKLLAVG